MLCLSAGIGADNVVRCSLGVKHTGVVGGDDITDFGTNVGSLDNPIVFTVGGKWPVSVRLPLYRSILVCAWSAVCTYHCAMRTTRLVSFSVRDNSCSTGNYISSDSGGGPR